MNSQKLNALKIIKSTGLIFILESKFRKDIIDIFKDKQPRAKGTKGSRIIA